MKIQILAFNLSGLFVSSIKNLDREDPKSDACFIRHYCGEDSRDPNFPGFSLPCPDMPTMEPKCQNGGKCKSINFYANLWNSYCECPEGFEGKLCQLDKNDLPCDRTPNPCQNEKRKICKNDPWPVDSDSSWFVGDYTPQHKCVCPKNTIGENCKKVTTFKKTCEKFVKKNSFCQIFEKCYFNGKKGDKIKDQCAEACQATLDYSNWSKEGCHSKKITVWLDADDVEEKACKGAFTEPRKCVDFIKN